MPKWLALGLAALVILALALWHFVLAPPAQVVVHVSTQGIRALSISPGKGSPRLHDAAGEGS
jgi:hypothetical protein